MSKTKQLVHRLDDIVQHAKRKTRLYQLLYDTTDTIESLANFVRLPILTDTILGTERLEDTLASLDQVCITRTFEDYAFSGASHPPKLLNYDDALDEYKVLAFMTEFEYLTGKHKVMLIADQRQVYAIAEFGKYLAYYELPLAVFIIRNQSARKLKDYLAQFKPTIVFVDSQEKLPTSMLPRSVKYLFTFNQPGVYAAARASTRSFQSFDIFREPRVGLLAVKSEEDVHYVYEPRHFYFESTPDQKLLITSFINRLQPVIRYQLGHQGTVTGANTFVVTG